MGPVAVVVVGVALLVGALYLLGTWGQDESASEPPPGDEVTREPTPGGDAVESPDHADRNEEARERPERVRLRLVATGEIYVCLIDARGRQVVDGEILQAGDRTEMFESRSFRANFGTSNVRMRANGRVYTVEPSSQPVGYRVTPGRRPQKLADEQRPDCS
jgi:hypothetical protein